MLYFYNKSRVASFQRCDFLEAMNKAETGDVIYCDPPYVPLSSTSNFTSYASGVFGFKEQLKLAEKAKEIAKKGISVLMSNHNTAFVLEAYSSAYITTLEVQRYISCDGSNRGKAREVLALFTGGVK